MQYIFDLKGSMYDRYIIPVINTNRTLKDINYRQINEKKRV